MSKRNETGIIRWTVIGLGAGLLAGCTTVPKTAGFEDVQSAVASRTAHLVQWRGVSADDAAVDEAVRSMLSHELGVDQAVQIALLNNRHLQATFENLGIAQADLVQAGLLKNPVFAASWRFPDQSPGGTNSEYSVAGDFLDLLIAPLRKQVAKDQFESTKLSVANDVLQLTAEVKTAYYTYQAGEQVLKRMQLVVELNQTAAELAKRQHEAGTLNELGLASQEVAYETSMMEVAQTEARLASDRERLNRLLGLWGDQTQWRIAPRLPELPPGEIATTDLETLAIRQRLDLGAARAQLISLERVLKITEKTRYFANVDVGIDTERESDGQHLTGPTLSLELPIFDQGQARVFKSQAQYRQLQRRYEAMTVDARSEVREAYSRMLAERDLVQRYKVLLPQRMRMLALTQREYNGMLKGSYDLLLAKQDEVEAEQGYVRAWRDYWIARTELERAVGGKLPASVETVRTAPATTQAMPSSQPNPEMDSAPEKMDHDMHDMGNMQDMGDMHNMHHMHTTKGDHQ